MALSTRAELVTLINDKILTGGRRTTGEAVREVLEALVESLSNISDDSDQNDGFLAIDSDGRVDATKINSNTPVGNVLSDSGTWVKRYFIPLFRDYYDAANISDGETNLFRNTIPANTIGDNGDVVEFCYGGLIKTDAVATRRIKVYFHTTVIYDSGVMSFPSNDSFFYIRGSVVRATGAKVRYMVQGTYDGPQALSNSYSGEITSLDFTSGIDIKITGQNSATVSDEIIAYVGTVDKLRTP